MITLLSVTLLGFFLGMRHATDADHVVAISTIVSRQRHWGRAALVGAIWGVGHTLTVLAAGGAIIVFGMVIPQRLGLSLEFSVALMLIGLGLWNVKSFFRPDEPPHRHDGWPEGAGALRPLFVGIVHGLAGSAAVALMVLPMVTNPWWAFAYLGVFGAGTIAGMTLITAAMAFPLRWAAGRFQRRIGLAAGFLSVGFGVFLAYEIGFVQGLLATTP